ncbi:MAG: DMT family transporter [Clostridiales bacterium]|jgi:drug/metabolite transporter (DMT)-like permease|nr:DMT family transporter [Clostridiales bacterium]
MSLSKISLSNLNKSASTACVFLTAIIWGLAFVAQRLGADFMGTYTFNGVRFMLGAVSLIPVIFFLERDAGTADERKYTLIAGIAGGLILFTASTLQQFGVVFTGSAGKAGFITGLYTVLVPIIGVFLGRKITALTWTGAISAVVGLYLLSVPEGATSIGIGDIVLLIGAFFWAIHIIVIDRYANRVKPLRFSMTQFWVCGISSIICALIFEDISPAGIIAGLAPILYGGVMSVGIAYTLQTLGQRGVEPAKAAIIFSLESLFSALGGAILLGETMSARGYVGCALIFTGIIVSQITLRKKAVA